MYKVRRKPDKIPENTNIQKTKEELRRVDCEEKTKKEDENINKRKKEKALNECLLYARQYTK